VDDDSDSNIFESHFEDIYVALHERGVPEERLPHPELILSMVMSKFLDKDLLNDWLEDYAELHFDPVMAEAVEAIEEAITKFSPPKFQRHRPSYIKVVEDSKPDSEPAPEKKAEEAEEAENDDK